MREIKRAQADFVTWMVATIIVAFIMALFLAGIIILAPQRDKAKIEINEKQEFGLKHHEHFLDRDNAELVLDFLENNKDAISGWADDGCYHHHTYMDEEEGCENMQETHQKLCDAIMQQFGNTGFTGFTFCLENRVGDKYELITFGAGDKSCGTGIPGTRCSQTEYLFYTDIISFFTNGGNLGNAYLYTWE